MEGLTEVGTIEEEKEEEEHERKERRGKKKGILGQDL